MNRILPLLLLALIGCAKDKPAESSGGVVAKDGGITDDTKVPADKGSRAFADHLVRNPVNSFKPGDTGAMVLTWTETRFGPKNRFQAQAVVDGGGEKFTCEEVGDWVMPDAAESNERASINLTIDKSTCPGRPNSGTLRMVLNVKPEGYDIIVH